MSALGEQYVCDKCGVDLGNGGVFNCIIVSDVEPDNPGMVRNLHFCRDRADSDGKKVKGCATGILSAANTAAYTDRKNKDKTKTAKTAKATASRSTRKTANAKSTK